MKIAIVDDSRAVHAFMEEAFVDSQAQLFHFYDGQSILDAISIKSVSPDLILLDWEMPILSGIEALPKIRAALPEATVFMMTSKTTMSDIVLALDHGAHDYMMKPFTKEILLAKIEQVPAKKVA